MLKNGNKNSCLVLILISLFQPLPVTLVSYIKGAKKTVQTALCVGPALSQLILEMFN